MKRALHSRDTVPPLPSGVRGESTWMCSALRSEERAGVRGPVGQTPKVFNASCKDACAKTALLRKIAPSPQPSPRRGEGAKRGFATLLCTFALSLASIGAHAQSSDNALYTPANIGNANGEQIFHSICQGCHMPDAQGATGAGTYPALTHNPKLASPQYMAAVILFGRHDMPSFVTKPEVQRGFFFGNTTLSDEQIAEVINYVRTHFGNTYSNSITAADVAAMHPQDHPSKSK
jgi:mono/diheme cytochrome c family protein